MRPWLRIPPDTPSRGASALQRTTPRKKHKGGGLIEILITLLVVSTGLLAYAAQLNRSIVSNRQAFFRGQAVIFASDMMERMRVNRVAAGNKAYDIALGSAGSGGTLAGNEVVDWKNALATEMPGGDGSINVSTSNGLNATIVIQWDDDGDGVPSSYSVESKL